MDTRDLRDPQKLGERLIEIRKEQEKSAPFHWIVDAWNPTVPDYDHGESLSAFTKRMYRAELKRAAERGDRHAADTLKGIPNDDPSGD